VHTNVYYILLFMPNVFIISWQRMKRALLGGFGHKILPPLPEEEKENVDVGQGAFFKLELNIIIPLHFNIFRLLLK